MKTKQPEINKITALYEYKKDPDDHDHWIIDEDSMYPNSVAAGKRKNINNITFIFTKNKKHDIINKYYVLKS